MSEIPYGYEAHITYCGQCHAYDYGDDKITERCAVGEALIDRERMSDAYDEGGEG